MKKCRTCSGEGVIKNKSIETMDDPIFLPCHDCANAKPAPAKESPFDHEDTTSDQREVYLLELIAFQAQSLERLANSADEISRSLKKLLKKK